MRTVILKGIVWSIEYIDVIDYLAKKHNDPDYEPEQPEIDDAYNEILSRLPEDYSLSFDDEDYGDLSDDEIADLAFESAADTCGCYIEFVSDTVVI